MKRLRLKSLAVGGLLTVSVVILALSPPRLGTERFQLEKNDIQEDLAGIQHHRSELATLKAQKKADKKAGNDMAVIADKKEIKKAKADLKRDKVYLRADKKDLKQDYRLTIREQKQELRSAEVQLSKAKGELRSALRQNDVASIKPASSEVTRLINARSTDKAMLTNLRSDRHEDLAAVNDAIGEANGQFGGTLFAENGYNKVSEWVTR